MQTKQTRSRQPPYPLFIFLILLPLLLSLRWYNALADPAYQQLQIAYFLARGQTEITEYIYPPTSPLFLLVTLLLSWLPLSLPWLAALLSGLGWGVAGIAFFQLGLAVRRPLAGATAAALLVFNPLIIQAAGTEWGWLLALGLFSLVFTIRQNWRRQNLSLLLVLAVHFSWLALLWVGLMWSRQWQKTRQIPWKSGLFLLVFSLVWASLLAQLWNPLIIWESQLPHIFFEAIFSAFRPGLTNEFYWLGLPLLILGLWTVRRQAAFILIGGLIIAAIANSLAAQVMLVAVTLFISGLGLEWLYNRVITTYDITLNQTAVLFLVVGCAGLPLIVGQAYSLWQTERLQPQALLNLETEAAQWLQTNSPPTATLYSSARLAYLAGRFPDASQALLVGPENLPRFWADVHTNPPNYFVDTNTLSWQLFQESGWFQERYQPAAHFDGNQNAALTVWQSQPRPGDEIPFQPLAWQTAAGFDLVGSKISPARPQAGEPVHLSLWLQATRPISEPVRAVLQVTNFPAGTAVSRAETIRPATIPLSWWQPGQIIEEQFVLSPGELPVGAYSLSISFLGQDDFVFEQTTAADDTSFTAVPVGTIAVTEQTLAQVENRSVQATFGDQIQLIHHEQQGAFSPGETVTINLNFTPQRPPDNDYTIFVHLLNEANELVVGDDRKPLDGRFPTQTWLPGDLISSQHTLALPADLPAGRYHLNLGFYKLETGERLPAFDANGQEQANGSFTLQESSLP